MTNESLMFWSNFLGTLVLAPDLIWFLLNSIRVDVPLEALLHPFKKTFPKKKTRKGDVERKKIRVIQV